MYKYIIYLKFKILKIILCIGLEYIQMYLKYKNMDMNDEYQFQREIFFFFGGWDWVRREFYW